MPASAISANVARASRCRPSGSIVSASAYICSRQVQNEPGPWARPRSARWKACECALASPGIVRPRQPLGVAGLGAGVHARRSAVAVDLDAHAGRRLVAAEPGVLAPQRGHEPDARDELARSRSNAARCSRSNSCPRRERRGIDDAVEEQHAVEVVELVLEGAGGQPAAHARRARRRGGRGSARGR